MIVTVEHVTYRVPETVGMVHGVTEDGKTVHAGVEWRYCLDLQAALERGESPEIEVEGWQLL